MRVALDAQLAIGTATGIGEYVRGLLQALRECNVEVVALCAPALDPWRFDRRVLWDQLLLPRRARDSGAQLLHCAAGTMPARSAMPVVVTVHDVAWHRVQTHAPPYARWYFGPLAAGRYARASRVVTDSEFTRDELLALVPKLDPLHVEVVYPGVAADFCKLERRAGDGRTILAVGTIERRKNLEVLVRALPFLPEARLIAVGPRTEYARECATIARRLGVADRIEMSGYVSRERLLTLYSGAAVAAVPSRYEGFGYAAAQALCAGLPCVVSDRTSLPEVAGGDAPIVPAEDARAWAAALATALDGGDEARAAQARARAIARFSWDEAARRMERVYAASIDR